MLRTRTRSPEAGPALWPPAQSPRHHVHFFSHDSVGLGHVQRNFSLAHAMAASAADAGISLSGLLITGEERAALLPHPAGMDSLLLPGITKCPGGYVPRHLDVPVGDLLSLRSRIVDGVWRAQAPDLVVIDRHPFGVKRELLAPLIALRHASPSTRIVLGLRDVLDEPEAMRREWARRAPAGLVAGLIDEIWVYGDRRLHDLTATGELPEELGSRVRYMGLLSSGRRRSDPEGAATAVLGAGHRPFVLTMAGGGSDGFDVVHAAASAPVPAGHTHLVVTGPQLPDDRFSAVVRAAGPRTVVRQSVPEGAALLSAASAAVIMGGYNTMCEALATDVPTLVVPRTVPRREQEIRAQAWARRGLVRTLATDRATPSALGRWFDRALATDRRAIAKARRRVDRAGLDHVGHATTSLFSSKETSHAA